MWRGLWIEGKCKSLFLRINLPSLEAPCGMASNGAWHGQSVSVCLCVHVPLLKLFSCAFATETK